MAHEIKQTTEPAAQPDSSRSQELTPPQSQEKLNPSSIRPSTPSQMLPFPVVLQEQATAAGFDVDTLKHLVISLKDLRTESHDLFRGKWDSGVGAAFLCATYEDFVKHEQIMAHAIFKDARKLRKSIVKEHCTAEDRLLFEKLESDLDGFEGERFGG